MKEKAEDTHLVGVEAGAGSPLERLAEALRGGGENVTVIGHGIQGRTPDGRSRGKSPHTSSLGPVDLTETESRYVDIDGPVHIAELGGDGQPVVCVHGLGGSHANWAAAAPALRRLGHVTAIDLPGFGLTPPAGRRADLDANRRVLDRYLRSIGDPVILVGNSMGGAITLRQAAVAPETVSRLVLVSPAAPWDLGHIRLDPLVAAVLPAYTLPGLGRLLLLARRTLLSPEDVAEWIIEYCTAHPERITPELLALQIQVAEERLDIPGVDRAFVEATRSVILNVARRGPFDRDVAATTAPTLVIHGKADRLVPYQAARRLQSLRPDWQIEIIDDAGHIAMLEIPDRFGMIVEEFVGRVPAA